MILPKRISLSGPKGAGKDTIANYLIEHEGYELSSMSKKLKDICATIFGWPRGMLDATTTEAREIRSTPDIWWERKLNWQTGIGAKLQMRFTPEVALQYIGTELFRDIMHEDIWIAAMERDMNPDGKYVTKDTRFENEFLRLIDMGYTTYEIKRGPETLPYIQAKNTREYFNRYGMTEDLDGITLDAHLERLARVHNIHISNISWVGLPFDKVLYNDNTVESVTKQLYI